jgi:hypothetical protein
MAARPTAIRAYAHHYAALPAVLFASILLLTGCATERGSAAPAGAVATLPPSNSPGPAPQGHAFGETVPANSGFVSATVFAYTEPTAEGAAPDKPGDEWAAADVQACGEAGSVFPVTVSDGPWSLRYADGTAASPTRSRAAQFPQPQYPATPSTLKAGECLRGWVMFAVPAGKSPQLVRYAPQGAAPIDWVIQ